MNEQAKRARHTALVETMLLEMWASLRSCRTLPSWVHGRDPCAQNEVAENDPSGSGPSVAPTDGHMDKMSDSHKVSDDVIDADDPWEPWVDYGGER
jgi:hypothetical protein